ncbi:MAG TPA: ATP-binding protein [Thermoanaerobaculia bacterium]|nr:ATP-binding protein [Thermoanaerobaculia bacterium]
MDERQVEELLDGALRELREAVLVADAGGRVVYATAEAVRLTQTDWEPAGSRRLAEILALRGEQSGEPLALPGPGDPPRDLGEAVVRGRQGLETPVRGSASPLPEGGLVVLLHEDSERRRRLRLLRASEERYRSFFELSSEGCWRCELERPCPVALAESEQIEHFYRYGYLAECNEVMARRYGFAAPAELVGARLSDLLPRSDAHNVEFLRAFVRSGYRLQGAESHEVDREGGGRFFVNNFVGVLEGGELLRAWGSQRDVTDRKRMEAELRRQAEELADADRRKDQFLALLAHELRNPLAPIRNAVEALRLDASSLEWSRAVVERQVRHLSRLVDDLLDVSRVTLGQIRLRRERIFLHDLVTHAVEASRPLIEERGHILTVALPADPVELRGDAARLEQVLTNLLNNAAKYTPPEGRIDLSAALEDGRVAVRVKDTGIGFPGELREGLFQPFVQAEPASGRADGGLGLGLALARSLVELHGGTIAAASEGPGLGSEFVVALPAAEASGEPEPAPPPQTTVAGRTVRGLRILVVDDNHDAAESLGVLLRIWGHDPSLVYDGPAALEEVRRTKPEVVLLDIGLPEMDGYEVARRLRRLKEGSDLLLVAVTGYGQREDRRLSQEAGFDDHLVKPVEPTFLRHLLASYGARDAPPGA